MYRITHSLLSSWLYFLGNGNKEEFIKVLKREKIPTNQYIQAGIDFEDECYKGNVKGISEIIEGGCFQARESKIINIKGYKLLLVGVLDVLKEGIIYDIKYTSKYDVGKFFNSTQHPMYFELVPQADKFIYLVGCNENIYYEEYSRDESRDIKLDIKYFLEYLENNEDLLKLYLENWEEKL